MGAERFAARPAATVIAQLAAALNWPRTRPARLLAGSRASRVASLVLCADEAALDSVDAPADAAVVLATPPSSSDGRLGRRAYDPFAGSPDDVASWRRAERVVLDASLLLSGGSGGVDEQLGALIGMVQPEGHRTVPPARSVRWDAAKLVGYVPTDALDSVRDAVFATGAGTIGDYDRCSWSTAGTGTFRGGEGANPAVGARGEFEQVAEVRFETVVAGHLVDRACRAFVAAHPYEEPAFDVIPLAIPAHVGFGRLGILGGGGGGAAAWSALAAALGDEHITAHGRVDQVVAGAGCIVHAGPLRDVLDAIVDDEVELGLVVVSHADGSELQLLEDRGIAALVVDRATAFAAHATTLAGRLTRALELPVTVGGALQFPTGDAEASVAAPAASTAASGGATDYAAGTWCMHFDGGSRGNPGPAAYGWVLYDPGGTEHEADGVTVGSTTNNVAEWTGLLRGLEHARARGIRSLDVRGDSELVVKQVNGVYKVKNAALKPLAEQVAALVRDFDRVDVRHVYRADNARADELANEALDGLR